MKDLITNLYRFFKAKEFKFEHLGRVFQAFQYPAEKENALAAIYTTGMIGLNMFQSEDIRPIENRLDIPSPSLAVEDQNTNDEDHIITDTPHPLPFSDESEETDTKQVDNTNEEIIIAEDIFETPNKVEEVEDTAPIVSQNISDDTPPKVIWEENVDELTPDLIAVQEDEEIEIKEVEETPITKEVKKKKKKKKKTIKAKKQEEEDKEVGIVSTPESNEESFDHFEAWLLNLQPLADSNLKKEVKAKKKKKKKKKKFSKVELSAKQSISKPSDVASATLAKLLSIQGHHAEAIEMYQKLIQLDPADTARYQKEIDKLNKKS